MKSRGEEMTGPYGIPYDELAMHQAEAHEAMLVAPTWKSAPDAPGKWIRHRVWDDTGDPYGQDEVLEIVIASTGLLYLDGNKSLRTVIRITCTKEKWFGPIPEPEEA